ncbi:MAG: hypothetical protein WCV62_03845 [Candidatus Peribacteraceae bacterium]|jgi:hypothetical protein
MNTQTRLHVLATAFMVSAVSLAVTTGTTYMGLNASIVSPEIRPAAEQVTTPAAAVPQADTVRETVIENRQEIREAAKENIQEARTNAVEARQELRTEAKERIQEVRSDVKERRQEVRAETQEKRQELRQHAKDRLQELREQAKERRQEIKSNVQERRQEILNGVKKRTGTEAVSESNPQPSPSPVSESNPQPSPAPVSESNPQPSPAPAADKAALLIRTLEVRITTLKKNIAKLEVLIEKKNDQLAEAENANRRTAIERTITHLQALQTKYERQMSSFQDKIDNLKTSTDE